jgi:hypothetical protein
LSVARVKFSEDHDYRPSPRVVIAYKAGNVYSVKRDCADEAVALGRGVEIDPPSREERQRPVMRTPRRLAKVQNANGG